MNKEEKNALITFLTFYILSAAILIGMIAYMYYKKEMVAIQEKCSMELVNAALMVEKELMSSQVEAKKYTFSSPNKNFKIGLFGENKQVIYSNLETDTIVLTQKISKTKTYEYYVDTLKQPYFGVTYIVVQGQEGSKEKFRLLMLLLVVSLVSLSFVGFVGFVLSQILIEPLKAKMEHLNTFIKDSSHDLNTPISALMMSVSYLKNKQTLDTRVLNNIFVSAKLISQIYNSLSYIAFNDRDEYFDESFDLQELVQESVRFFEDIALLKGNHIEVDLEPTFVYMDKSRIQKLINNLLSNSIKYSYQNTKIHVGLKKRILTFKDSGIGISKEDQNSIFNRYQRRSKEQGGFGIGLDIVKSVCQTYGIRIWIESTLAVGSTFYLEFPEAK